MGNLTIQRPACRQQVVPLLFLQISICVLFLFISKCTYAGNNNAGPVIPDDRVTIGLFGGYSSIPGYYSGKLNSSIAYGMYITFPLNRYVMADTRLALSSHEFTSSNDSFLYSYEMTLAPLLYYDVHENFRFFAGAGLDLRYLRVNAVLTGQEVNTFKPGYVLTAGSYVKITHRLSLRVDAVYSQVWLSREPLLNNSFNMGVSYTLAAGEPGEYREEARKEMRSSLDRARENYRKGIKELKNRKAGKAKEYFQKALSLDPDLDEAVEKLEEIREAENAYDEAVALLARDRYYTAIPYLIHASAYMEKAGKKLENTRNMLKDRIDTLEKNGIEAFNKRNYEACISIMQKILLIDPENQVARVYLSRAKKHLRTMEKFQ